MLNLELDLATWTWFLGAICVVFGLVSSLELRDQCFAFGGCLLGKWYAQRVPLFLCLSYFEMGFWARQRSCRGCAFSSWFYAGLGAVFLRYLELSFKDFEMIFGKSFEKKLHGFGKGF